MKNFSNLPHWLWLSVLYLVTHVPFLLALPIFADEAIYIHWAQLVTDDMARFAFFSMSDGKPPLFMWLLSAVTRIGGDPLWMSRFVAVCIGLITVHLIGKVTLLLTGRLATSRVAELITVFAPFWWFYHRMALMDGLLTLCILASFYFALRIAIKCQKESGIAYDTIPIILSLGVSFGGALMTKTPSLFAIPIIAITPLFAAVRQKKQQREVKSRLLESFLLVGIGGVIGCVFFILLKVSPFFGDLFARSTSFTFSIREVLQGEWKYVLFSSLPREFVWISGYQTIAAMCSIVSGLWFARTRKQIVFLIAAAVIFAAPLVAFGRVLYPRYFLPTAPFLTIAAAIGWSQLASIKKLKWATYFIAGGFFLQSLLFILPSVIQIESIPFTPIDRMQYLEEWSAGFGNNEVRDFVRERYRQVGATKRIIVLTEGAFGTLPDGLSIYFFGPGQLNGVEIHGIGVGPSSIPSEYTKLLPDAEVYYVVNSHRFRIADMNSLENVFTVPRPNNAPSLLLYRVK